MWLLGSELLHHCAVRFYVATAVHRYIDHLATHSLRCRWSKGRHRTRCYTSVNDIIHWALTLAILVGSIRSIRKCPDGATIVPCKSGRTLVWDASCEAIEKGNWRAEVKTLSPLETINCSAEGQCCCCTGINQ